MSIAVSLYASDGPRSVDCQNNLAFDLAREMEESFRYFPMARANSLRNRFNKVMGNAEVQEPMNLGIHVLESPGQIHKSSHGSDIESAMARM